MTCEMTVYKKKPGLNYNMNNMTDGLLQVNHIQEQSLVLRVSHHPAGQKCVACLYDDKNGQSASLDPFRLSVSQQPWEERPDMLTVGLFSRASSSLATHSVQFRRKHVTFAFISCARWVGVGRGGVMTTGGLGREEKRGGERECLFEI